MSELGLEPREFTKFDWFALGGASTFEDGAKPLIAELDDGPTVIIDEDGVHVTHSYGDGETIWTASLLMRIPCQEIGRIIMRGLDSLHPDRLRAMGFSVEYERRMR